MKQKIYKETHDKFIIAKRELYMFYGICFSVLHGIPYYLTVKSYFENGTKFIDASDLILLGILLPVFLGCIVLSGGKRICEVDNKGYIQCWFEFWGTAWRYKESKGYISLPFNISTADDSFRFRHSGKRQVYHLKAGIRGYSDKVSLICFMAEKQANECRDAILVFLETKVDKETLANI